MNSDRDLEQQVKKYYERRLRRWSIILLMSLCLLALTLSSLSCALWYRLRNARHQNQQLSSEHKALTHHWKLFQVSSKQLKTLIAEEAFQEPSKVASYLKSISESIPERTLLTRLTCKDSFLTLEGYTDSLEELGSFIASLSQKGIPLTLKQSYHLGSLLFYELATKESTPLQKASKKKSASAKDAKQKSFLPKK